MTLLSNIKQYLYPFLALLALGFFSLDVSAEVLVDSTAVDTAFSDLTDTVTYFEGKVWPLVFLITGITIGIGLFKRFTRLGAR